MTVDLEQIQANVSSPDQTLQNNPWTPTGSNNRSTGLVTLNRPQRAVTVVVAPYAKAQVNFSANCAYRIGNFPCAFNASPPSNNFTCLGGSVTYQIELNIRVNEDRGAIMASVQSYARMGGVPEPGIMVEADTSFNGGRAF